MSISRKVTAIMTGIMMLLTSGWAWAETQSGQPVSNSSPVGSAYASDELIVKYKSGVDETQVNAKVKAKVAKKNSKLGISRIKLDPTTNLTEVMSKLKSDPGVEYVEPNYFVQMDMAPNDPSYGSQWGLPKIKADQAWDTTTGSNSITIAILDTGVDADHPDLAGHLVPGYNTINDTTNTDDDHGHGTHVAGISAGIVNNGVGIAGVAGNCNIMPVKVLSSNGSGLYSDFAEGIVWAADHGAMVINMSLGGNTFSQALQDAVDYAYNQGAIIIAASGNANTSTPHYPAAMNHVVAVAATDANNARASFSNYGAHIDIAAPGVNIYSTFPNTAVTLAAQGYSLNYTNMSGTSMATPFVSGVAALVLSNNPSLTPGQLERVLEVSAVDIGSAGKDTYFGYGLINAYAALTTPVDLSPVGLTLIGDTPDPFGPTGSTLNKITFTLAESAFVTVKIYDSSNNLVQTLLNRVLKSTGTQYVTWNGKNSANVLVPEGTYTYVVQAEDYSANQSTPLSGTITVDRTAPIVSGLTVSPDPFAPTGSNTVDISYTLSEAGKATVNIYNSLNVLVKSLASNVAQNAGSNSLTWDGKNSTGVIQGDGTYTVKVDVVDTAGWKAVQQTKSFAIERNLPTITAVSDTPDPFKATGTTLNTIKYTLSENCNVTIKIYDSSNNLIKTLVNGAVTAGAKSITWNGKNDSGVLVTDGIYTYKINAVDAAANAATEVSGSIALDKTIPVISSVADTPDPFAPTGSNTADISYSLSESSKVTITIYNSANTAVKTLLSNVQKNSGVNSITWDGKGTSGTLVPDGLYTYKIMATDLVGFAAAPVSGTITVEKGNPTITAVSDTPDPFKATGTTLNTIKYTLSENCNVTINIYDSSNNIVKTLVNGAVTIGAKAITWNGKNDLGVLVSDGIYTYKINAVDTAANAATEVTGTITLDKTIPVISAVSDTPDPFATTGSNTADISYTLSESSKVTITIFNSTNIAVKALLSNIQKNSGANSITWDGKATNGTLVPDGLYTYKIIAIDLVGFAATPVSGTITVEKGNPTITTVSDTPDPFRPTGTTVNTIKYTLSEDCTVALKIFDSSNNLVRTLVNGPVTYGAKTAAWNGKNDANVLIGSGTYTYKIDATDAFAKTAVQVTGTIDVDVTPPTVNAVSAAPNPFTPTGLNTTTISYDVSENAKVTIIIYNSSNVAIKTLCSSLAKTAGPNSITWNGKNNSNVILPAGTYTYRITAVDLLGNAAAPVTGNITIS